MWTQGQHFIRSMVWPRKEASAAGLGKVKVVLALMATAILAAAGARAHGEGVNAPAASAALPDPNASFASIIERVTPAVVSIEVELAPTPNASAGPRRRQVGPGGAPTPPRRATGSGFFIRADGYILTNNHVIADARTITVRTADKRDLRAKLVGRDPETDLAVLKVEVRDAPFIDPEMHSTPRVGDWIVAVGSPFNLGGTATVGIVSALVRPRPGGSAYVDYIQIDAAINKGNSGGPTFDAKGRLVGVNTAILSPTGGSVGIGFDIPAPLAASISRTLIAEGVVTRGYLGATIQEVTPAIAASLGIGKPTGALVSEVVANGPGAKSGLQPGDLVVQVEGQEVGSASDLTRRVAATAPGDSLRLVLRRNGAKMDLIVRAGVRPATVLAQAEGAGANLAALGLTLTPNRSGGMLITQVAPTSDARAKGVRPGDVLEEVAGRDILTLADLEASVAEARAAGRDKVLVRIGRRGQAIYLPLDLRD